MTMTRQQNKTNPQKRSEAIALKNKSFLSGFCYLAYLCKGCGMKDVPGGYTRVNRYVRWMMHKITDITPKVSVCNGTFGTWIGKRVG